MVTASPLRRSVRVAFFTRMAGLTSARGLRAVGLLLTHPRVEADELACYRYQRFGNVCGWRALAVCLVVVLWVAGLAGAPVASAEDGYDLWLRYRPIEQPWIAIARR